MQGVPFQFFFFVAGFGGASEFRLQVEVLGFPRPCRVWVQGFGFILFFGNVPE